jgi:RNA polymerase sigma-70 factor, ECF subfamily
MDEASDDVLWRRTSHDDRDAFGELFDRHAQRVFGFCFRQTANRAVAEDLLSVTFLEAWRRRRAVVDEGKVPAWLLGIALNAVRHQRRSVLRYRRALKRLPAPLSEPDHAEESTARVLAERDAAELLSRLKQIPAREQAVVALVAWEGLTSAEAAIALELPEATVRSRLHRARRRLQRNPEPNGADPPAPRTSVSIDEGTGL